MDKKECKFDYAIMNDGSIKLNYADSNGKVSLGYDITSLIINTNPINVEGHILYDCVVSWGDSKTGNFDEYYNILVEFDKSLLFGDSKYYEYFMSKLLAKKRVMKYLSLGFDSKSETKCGLYIGCVEYDEDGKLKRCFYGNVGSKCHNEDYMVTLRDANGRTR